jgi:hypothetical protein
MERSEMKSKDLHTLGYFYALFQRKDPSTPCFALVEEQLPPAIVLLESAALSTTLRMTHYFSWVFNLQILIYPAGLIFLDEYTQMSYNDNSRIDFSAATEP